MKCLTILCLFILFAFYLPAQDLMVSNVTFQQDNELIKIRYDLNGKSGKKYPINLILSSASNKTFSHIPRAVTGDVGKVAPGTGKEIVWALTKDFPDGLKGDAFVFTVTAHYKKSNLPNYLLGGGAALLGGVAYIVTQNGKAETTGSISITIPGDI